MRSRVYRNFTFRAYEAGSTTAIDRSDNFFTVESHQTAVLKQIIEDSHGTWPGTEFIICQESKDGVWCRPIERIYIRPGDDTIYISMIYDVPADTTDDMPQ